MAIVAMAAYAFFVLSILMTQVVFVAGLIALLKESIRRAIMRNAGVQREEAEDLPFISLLLAARDEIKSLERNCAAFQQVRYPQGKSELIILTEEHDIPTTGLAASLAGKYENVRSVVIPRPFLGEKHPTNKPRALIYGLTQLDERSAVVGVLDAEDLVSENILLEAAKGLREFPIAQGRLTVRNAHENLLTFWYGSEYAFLELLQRGRQLLKWITFPRGSTYFVRRELVRELGWHSLSLTEDMWFNTCAYAAGHRTALLDTVTWEESPVSLGVWIKQRTRWFQGKLQAVGTLPDMHGLRLDQRLSVLQLLHGTLVTPLATVLTLPFLVHDSIFFALLDVVPPLHRGPAYTYLWAASLAGLILLCLQFAGATLFTYRSQRGVWLRVLACFLLPIEFILLLPAAALRAYWRQFLGKIDWEKTLHRGETCRPVHPQSTVGG